MNTTAGLGSMPGNTITAYGNMSGVDSGYVIGNFRRAIDNTTGGTYEFPLGLETAGATLARGVQYTEITTSGVNTYDYITGYWEQGSGNTFAQQWECSGWWINYFAGAASGQWNFSSATSPGTGTYQLAIWPQDHTATPQTWNMVTKNNAALGTANTCSGTLPGLTRPGYTGFPGTFGFAGSTSILSAEITELFATPVNNTYIRLDWRTTKEINNSGFEVQRSKEGQTFETIGWVDGAGNSNQTLSYQFRDEEVEKGIVYYYRLMQVDFDGSYQFTNLAKAALIPEGEEYILLTLYPNPTMDGATLLVENSEPFDGTYTLHDMLGKLIQQKAIAFDKGNNPIQINTNKLPGGTYFVTLTGNGKRITRKLIVQK
jgi:Secretion system C-terminal sorting domain